MTLYGYIYEIRQLLPNDYKNIDDRLIKRWIDLTRSVWIKNRFNENNTVDNAFKQSIYLEIQPYDQSILSFIPTASRILKSNDRLPDLIYFGNRDGVMSVRNAKVISEKYNYVTREQAV